jgi:hypothetical protein
MNPRNVIIFFKSPVGAFILFCAVLAILFFACKRFLPGATKPLPLNYSTKAAAAAASKQTVQTYENTNYSAMANIPTSGETPSTASENRFSTSGSLIDPSSQVNGLGNSSSTINASSEPSSAVNDSSDSSPELDGTADPASPQTTSGRAGHALRKPEVLPISLFADSPQPGPKQLSQNYAPYGRLIPCELIVTVDSASIQTPIIGLVTDDIYHNGRLIIPAGTEVHGRAQTDRSRERIASGDNWTLVWQNGQELHLSGIALDREADPNGSGWAITDGSAGLRGQVLKTDNLAEIKLFAATFLSGAAAAFTQTQPTVYGSQILPTLQNAPLTGAQSVMQTYAQQILDTIQRDGFYVRVPAGKQFYLYVTQTIDDSDASIGGSRSAPNDFTNEINQTSTPSRRNYLPDAYPYRNGVIP